MLGDHEPLVTGDGLKLILIGSQKNGAPIYKLAEDLHWAYSGLGLDIRVRVPKGFPTDLASTPKLVWRWFPPNGKYAKAAIIHDWLCVVTGNEPIAHDLFRLHMRESKVGLITRQVIWFFVSLYGRIMKRKWIIELEGSMRRAQERFVAERGVEK